MISRVARLGWAPLLVSMFAAGTASGAEFMFRAMVGERPVEGQALFWNSSQMLLLARDGQLEQFDPRQATGGKMIAPEFIPYSMEETRQRLLQEFGPGFRVTTAGHHYVVHAANQSSDWASRFETLYRQFHSYFRVRGFQLEEPRVPLVAVVFPTRDDYITFVRGQGIKFQESMLGHYDPQSNRVLMYDQSRSTGADETLETIIHEATHQTAYNVGLHSRVAVTPRWLVEGLAMMFEVEGVYGNSLGQGREHRVHPGRLADFRSHVAATGGKGLIRRIVASDQAFHSDAIAAYGSAWALSFYLSETRPRQYEAYLKLTADRPPLANYPPKERLDDFASQFGGDLVQLESDLLRWIERL